MRRRKKGRGGGKGRGEKDKEDEKKKGKEDKKKPLITNNYVFKYVGNFLMTCFNQNGPLPANTGTKIH